MILAMFCIGMNRNSFLSIVCSWKCAGYSTFLCDKHKRKECYLWDNNIHRVCMEDGLSWWDGRRVLLLKWNHNQINHCKTTTSNGGKKRITRVDNFLRFKFIFYLYWWTIQRSNLRGPMCQSFSKAVHTLSQLQRWSQSAPESLNSEESIDKL